MENKTPQFDLLIQEMLRDLIPHTRICPQATLSKYCENNFEIKEKDIEFLKIFKVPPPLFCPTCRRQQRLAFANYTTLYKRLCNVPGHTEEIISSMPPTAPFPVYDFKYYWSNEKTFSRPLEKCIPTESFFHQLKNLWEITPQPALSKDPSSKGSDYTLYGLELNNSYYTFGGLKVDNTHYSMWPLFTRDSMDLLIAIGAEHCYESVFPEKCFNCSFVYFSRNCLDSMFLYECRNCTDCFGCTNLRNKKHCFFNEQLTEEEYNDKIKKIDTGNRKILEEYKEKFWAHVKSNPVRGTRNEHSINSNGNYIIHSKDISDSMWVLESDHSRRIEFVLKLRDCADISIGSYSEHSYCGVLIERNSYNILFSAACYECGDCEYLINCRNCKHCFGCVGLESKQFCILNIQYTEKEYYKTIDKIKTEMLKRGEYGNMFPLSFSFYPYNGSLSAVVFPLSEIEVGKIGGWQYESPSIISKDITQIDSEKIPQSINDVDDSILELAIISKTLKKPFRLIPDELKFYRSKNLPIPLETPYTRMTNRFEYVNYFKTENDVCDKCKKDILAGNSHESGFRPYCEECYQQEVL
jgi:hypothetical protein